MKKFIIFSLILAFFFAPKTVLAVGSGAFENASFSAASLGQGNAVVAQGDEPAAISYNPAGVVQLKGVQAQGSGILLGVFTHRTGTNGDEDQSGSTHSFIPTAYLTVNPGKILNDRLAFGIGSDSPFGLSNRYDSAAPYVHYTGYSNYLKMYTIKPVMSLKLTDKIMVGGGPMYYRVFDFGGVQAYPNQALGLPLPDGQVRINESGNSWGWQLGALVKPTWQHSFGFYFRSPVHMRTRGLIKVENATIGGNFETGGDTKIAFPLNMTFGYAYRPTKRSLVEADFGYTRWSTFERTYFNHAPVGNSNDAILNAIGTVDRDFNDGYSLHLGGHYDTTDKLTLRGGSFFFWASVPADHWVPSIPDANRLAFTFGPSYKISKHLTFDASYLAEFALRRKIDNGISESLGTSVDGRYFSYIHGVYLTLTYKWEDFSKNKRN